MESQQQQTSSLQAGQSTADGASRHSSGAHPHSAQRMTSFVATCGEDFELTNTQFPHLIGKVGSVRHHRGWHALEASSSECYEQDDEQEANHVQQPV